MGKLDKNDIYDEGKSIALNLEALNSEYKNLLNSYQEATINYINYLQEQSTNPCNSSNNKDYKNCLAIIKNQSFWGVSGISQSSVSSPEECAISCAKTAECSGATFNPDNNICILRKGEGTATPTKGSYAIVSKGKKLLQIVEHINTRLTEINQQITNLIDEGTDLYNLELSSIEETQQQNLLENYNYLVKERENIRQMLNQYQDTESAIEQGNIVITKNYYTYILLFALAIIAVFILMQLYIPTNTQYGGGKINNNILYILFCVLLVILVIHFSKNL